MILVFGSKCFADITEWQTKDAFECANKTLVADIK